MFCGDDKRQNLEEETYIFNFFFIQNRGFNYEVQHLNDPRRIPD